MVQIASFNISLILSQYFNFIIMKPTLLIILFCCLIFNSYSQFTNYAFEDVSREELLMKDCPFEPGAPAMIIAEKCELTMDLQAPYHSKRITRRIKILTKEGLSYGNFEISHLSRLTDIAFFRASVFNLENDMIVEEKIKSNDATITQIDKYNTKYTVSLPNVKIGSVIDIYYWQKDNNMISIQPWYFQSEIPCGWSEYITKVQKKATYSYYYTEFLPFAVNSIKDISLNADRKAGFIVNRFAVENAPSYHLNEMFILRPEDQLSKVELVYNSYNQNSIWGNSQDPLSWTEIRDNLLKSKNLGKVLDKGKFLHPALEKLFIENHTFTDSLREVYEFIRQSVKCNGYRSIYAGDIRKTMDEKSGNTGEINLLLLAALREAGFDCHPLLLATYEDAPPSKTDPRRSGASYLVAAVFNDTSIYLLDASKREIAFNTLPLKCLNGDGFLVSEHLHRFWIPLLRNERFESKTSISYAWDPEKPDTVHVEKSSWSLSANNLRNIQLDKGEDEYIKSRKLFYQNYNISTLFYKGLNETDNPFVESFSFVLKPVDYNTTESYFLQTIPFDGYKENPFDGIKRDFRIDFQAPIIQNFDLTVYIPKGFSIVSLPESVAMTGIGNDLVFDFSVIADADKREIHIHSAMQIKKDSFPRGDYNDVRQFFAEIVKAQNTLIELKKDENIGD